MTRVAVTTELDAAGRIGRLTEEAGLEPVYLPCIRTAVSPPEILDPLRAASRKADWVVCTSQRAVSSMWPTGGMPTRPLVAAVGAATARAVTAAGGRVAVTGTGGAAALREILRGRLAGQVVVFPHARAADPATVEMLRSEGASVVAGPAYETLPVAPANDPVNAVIFGSPSALGGWLLARDLSSLVVAAMGQTTAAALRGSGREPDVVPQVPGAAAVVAALASYVNQLSERSSQ
jgi:uroporphyrinogen-III synthase